MTILQRIIKTFTYWPLIKPKNTLQNTIPRLIKGLEDGTIVLKTDDEKDAEISTPPFITN